LEVSLLKACVPLEVSRWGGTLSSNCSGFPSKILLLDTTLRDGEQTPGVSLTPEKKLRIAVKLDELGVDFIEAGFAAASQGEFEAVKLVSSQGLRAEVYSFSRGVKSDIDSAADAGADGITLTLPTSDLHITYKLKKDRDYILRSTEECVTYAKSRGLTVEFLAEDGSRSDLDFLEKVFTKAVECGADRVCLCDTVGVLTVEKTGEVVRRVSANLKAPLAIHCHNDFGLAVSNSIVALKSGAQEAHVTVNGLGERAGNAALEELAVSLNVLYGCKLNIRMELIYETSRLVSRLTGIFLQPNKAIVGDNAFTHESGIHTHGVLSNPATYEPISPELVGASRRIVVGKHAGSHGIEAVLRSMGLTVTKEQLSEILRRVKTLGDKGKQITDADLQAIAEAVLGLPKVRPIHLKELTVVTGNRVTPTASVKLALNGKIMTESATGVGPVDAAINAIRKAVSAVEPIQLEEYHVKAITGGTDAVVEVLVRLRKGAKVVTAMGARGDIVMASVEAVLNGMNTLLVDYERIRGGSRS
jgi:D-citramalate synthase